MYSQSSARRSQAGDRIWCKASHQSSQNPRQQRVLAHHTERNRCESREEALLAACENRALVTLDKGFGYCLTWVKPPSSVPRAESDDFYNLILQALIALV